MSEHRREDVTLDEAIGALRADEAPQLLADAAAARVWSRLDPRAVTTLDAIRGCADVRALGLTYERGDLPEARALLVRDHLRECPLCRAAVRHPGAPRLAVLPWRREAAPAVPVTRGLRRYALAASVLIAVGAIGLVARQAFFAVPPGSRAAVRSVTGALHRVSASEISVLAPGQEILDGEAVRTARGSLAALRLSDGSVVEMGERAELFLTARGQDATIHLERGSIIVQAAKRKTGLLLVASGDCTVKVTGTVFSVNRGLKGSRVSVLEGQVRVARAGAGDDAVLAPGEQWTTGPAVASVPVRDEVAWSAEVDRHLALLGEVKALREAWRAVAMPGVRYESHLLQLLPEGAVVYAGIPNYGEALGEAHRLFEERLRESAVLRDWWTAAVPERHGDPGLAATIEKIRTFADFLGDEVVLALASGTRHGGLPVVLAEVRHHGLREALEQEIAAHETEAGRRPVVRIVGDGDGLDLTAKADLFVLLRRNVVAVTPSREILLAVAGRLESAGPGLTGTPFGARIAQAYAHGAGILFAADLERITTASLRQAQGDPRRAATLRQAGLDGLRHLVFERRSASGDEAQTQALLAFAGPRRGIPSWIAEPAPMGALDFVSTNAQAAAAFVFKSPSLVLDDIIAVATAGRPDARKGMEELEGKLGFRLREDMAETLGGEFVVALDGPLLPTPSWKLVIEVYDPVRLQESVQSLVSRANEEDQGRPGLRLSSEQVGPRVFHAIRGERHPFELHYAFVDGYLVAGPSRALVMRAAQVRESGSTLASSAQFRALFPPDRAAHVSALLYQNLGPMVGSLLDAAGSVSAQTRSSAEGLAREARPTLLCAYGEEDAIRLAGMGGLFDLNLGELALPMLLERAGRGTREGAKP